MERASDRYRSSQAKVGSAGESEDDSPSSEPRLEAVAGKMWCVADLNHEYIASMEDVLKVHENPLSERKPLACVDNHVIIDWQFTRRKAREKFGHKKITLCCQRRSRF
jgi:hypothetical protein